MLNMNFLDFTVFKYLIIYYPEDNIIRNRRLSDKHQFADNLP